MKSLLSLALLFTLISCGGGSASDSNPVVDDNEIPVVDNNSEIAPHIDDNELLVVETTDDKFPELKSKNDQVAILGSSVALTSYQSKGEESVYRWEMVSQPEGSQSHVNDSNAANTFFDPDIIGTYVLSLIRDNNQPIMETVAVGTPVEGLTEGGDTWTLANSPYVITGLVEIPFGDTLTIDPGVVVLGLSGLSSWEPTIWIHGELKAIGTEAQRIHFQGVTVSYTDIVETKNRIDVDYAYITDGAGVIGGSGYVSIKNSIVFEGTIGVDGPPSENSYIENNILINTWSLRTASPTEGKMFVRNNVFYEPLYSAITPKTHDISQVVIENNSFLDGSVLVVINDDQIAINNYWGTVDSSIVPDKIHDNNDDPEIEGVVEYMPILVEKHPNSPEILEYLKVLGLPVPQL